MRALIKPNREENSAQKVRAFRNAEQWQLDIQKYNYRGSTPMVGVPQPGGLSSNNNIDIGESSLLPLCGYSHPLYI